MVYRPEPLLFLSSSSSIVLTRLSGPSAMRETAANAVMPGQKRDFTLNFRRRLSDDSEVRFQKH
jgi:hypothetical protein